MVCTAICFQLFILKSKSRTSVSTGAYALVLILVFDFDFKINSQKDIAVSFKINGRDPFGNVL